MLKEVWRQTVPGQVQRLSFLIKVTHSFSLFTLSLSRQCWPLDSGLIMLTLLPQLSASHSYLVTFRDGGKIFSYQILSFSFSKKENSFQEAPPTLPTPEDFPLCFISQIWVACQPLLTGKGNAVAHGAREGAKFLQKYGIPVAP